LFLLALLLALVLKLFDDGDGDIFWERDERVVVTDDKTSLMSGEDADDDFEASSPAKNSLTHVPPLKVTSEKPPAEEEEEEETSVSCCCCWCWSSLPAAICVILCISSWLSTIQGGAIAANTACECVACAAALSSVLLLLLPLSPSCDEKEEAETSTR
jgi:hypothetical protein